MGSYVSVHLPGGELHGARYVPTERTSYGMVIPARIVIEIGSHARLWLSIEDAYAVAELLPLMLAEHDLASGRTPVPPDDRKAVA